MEKRKEEEGNQGNGYTKQKATTRDGESSEGTFSRYNVQHFCIVATHGMDENTCQVCGINFDNDHQEAWIGCDNDNVRESVDSLCRDGEDMPMPPYQRKACNHLNATFFR